MGVVAPPNHSRHSRRHCRHCRPGPRDVLLAGTVGGLVAGLPSTVHALATGRRPLEATLAAGTLVLPADSRPAALLAAAVPVHAALSVGWATVLAAALPRRRAVLAGAAAGLVIAAADLGIVGRRFPRVRALPTLPQVADHVAYGLAVGWMLARRRDARGRVDDR
jgi:hypothetical protein